MNEQNNGNSSHILNTSSNLLGLCFIVLTSLKVLHLKEATIIDEITAITIVFFMTSSVLSFLSMRSVNRKSDHFEKVADTVFLIGLVMLFVTTMLIAFNLIR
jgi:hypothetical protein